MYFFVDLSSRADDLIISTYGGEGTVYMTAEGEIDYGYYYEFDEDMIFFDEDFYYEEKYTESFYSYGDGTDQDIYIYSPAEGQFEITLYAVEDFSDVSIAAYWEEDDRRPEPKPDPDPNLDPEDIYMCDEDLEEFFEDIDLNGDGLLNADEFRRSGPEDDLGFSDVDISDDGMIEFKEVVAYICTCDNELMFLADQLPYKTSIEFFESLALLNDFDTEVLDVNEDGFISYDEVEEGMKICTTTFNPFDSDGDGVPDIDDQFPNDPDESKDADGDGIGDNADLSLIHI